MLSSFPTTMARVSGLAPVSLEPALQEALDKAMGAIRCGNAAAAVHSLSASLGGDQRTFHNTLLNLLDSASGKMRQRLIDEARSQRTDFALDAHNRQGKTVLDLAVRHNDTEFADYLLRHGAHPERTSLAGASADMQALVTRWRLKNLVYADRGEAPQRSEKLSSFFKFLYAEPDHGKWTPLDRTLSNGNYKEADKLLQKAMDGNSLMHHSTLWYTAMEKEQHDVLRAMLILRPDALRELAKDQQEVGEWLSELRQDPGLSAALKEFPYQSAKRGVPKYLNCTVQFRSTAELIECRHLSTYQQEMQALDPKIKFDYRKFGSVEDIANNVQPGIEKTYSMLKAQASVAHLIDNRKFGQFLAGQFQEMEGEDKPATRLMLVESTSHTMNLGLMIKEKEGKKSYVVKFFDPNDTTTGTRSKASSVQTFEMQTIKDYLAVEAHRHYYPEAKGLSMIFVRSETEEEKWTGASAISGSAAGRRLTTCIDIKDVDATAVWHFMACGFDANLRDLQDHLGTLSEAQRLRIIAGESAIGTSALWIAMQEGHEEAIKAYGELVRQAGLIPEQLIELLAGKDEVGVPALFMAMGRGHEEAIKAYGELVRQAGPIPERQLIELLAGKDEVGVPALIMAMQAGHAKAVKAYGELVRQAGPIPERQLIELLAGKAPEGTPALMMAMGRGQAEAVKAYGELVRQAGPISEKQLIELLAGKDKMGAPALFMAMGRGHEESIKAYGELVRQAGPISEKQLIELLEGKSPDGIPALMMAMGRGQVNVIEAYGEAVKSLPLDKQADLLLAKTSTGPSAGGGGFIEATERGHFGAANAQLQLLVQLAPSLSEGKRAELRKEFMAPFEGVNGIKMRGAPNETENFRKMFDTLSTLQAELSKDQAVHE